MRNLKNRYHQQYERLASNAERLDPEASSALQSLYTFFSANLLHYLPNIPADQHLRYFRLCCHYQKLNLLDQQFFRPDFPLEIHGWNADWVADIRRQPGIICTMHSGSYRLLNFLLAKEGVSHALLMAAAVKQEQEALIRQLYPQLGIDPMTVPFIDAEKISAPRTIMRMIEQGISVVVYIDGDAGTPLTDYAKLLRIPFLGQHLHVRRGIARIAHWARTPIYPIFNFREDQHTLSVHYGETLHPNNSTLAIFEDMVIRHIYGHFAALLMHYPMQWENWFRLHLNIDLSHRIQPNAEQENVGLFESDGDYFVLEKHNYQVSPLAISD